MEESEVKKAVRAWLQKSSYAIEGTVWNMETIWFSQPALVVSVNIKPPDGEKSVIMLLFDVDFNIHELKVISTASNSHRGRPE